MRIDEIRSNFSKANISVSNSGISIFYMYNDRWFSQSVDADIVLSLLSSSNSLTIECNSGSYIKLRFSMNIGAQSPVLYPRICDEISLDEIKEIYKDFEDSDEGFVELLIETDPDNDDEINEEFLKYVRRRISDEPEIKTDMDKWSDLMDFASDFAGAIGAVYDVMEPSKHNEGSICITVIDEQRKSINIVGVFKSLLEKAVELSSTIDIDGSASDGIVNITFYS